jgi:glutathione S-transferase
MLTLYIKKGCPYCAKVLAAGEQLGIEFDIKNVADEGVSEELIARGGKKQMPYFVDTDAGVEMYESEDIIAYLHHHFGKDGVG